MKGKNFNISVLLGVTMGMIIFALPTIIIDPYFHYHKPLTFLYYPIDSERYQNNGITKNFDYNAIITGTSMTENFRTSELNEIFGVNSIKVPYSGGTYKEINKNILVGLETHDDVKIVVRGIDYTGLIADKDLEKHEADLTYPHYLNDNNIFNDIHYVLNKNVFALSKNILFSYGGEAGATSFDEYSNWNEIVTFGKEAVMKSYTRVEIGTEVALSDEEKEMIRGNIRQNVVETAQKYPNTTFYLFITPYSVCYWDGVNRSGKLGYWVEAERTAIEEMLRCDNIKLFSFTNNFEWTCNLDNYKDQAHYGEWINSAILQNMYEGKWQLTKENYEDYLQEIMEFYSNYDYDELYK